MQTLYAIHAVDQDKLAEVVAEMRSLGAPKIRVVDCGDYLMALEGTHRLAACAALGLAPELDVLAQDEMVAADSLDWQDLEAGEQYTAGELAGEVFSPSCGVYQILGDGTIAA
jgi:hypothetical protein